MDSMDFLMWQEFFDPDSQYECPDCGTLFGDDCVTRSEDDESHVYECPGCGCSGIVE